MGEGAPEKQLKMGKKATLLLMHLFLVIATYIVAGFTIAGWFAGMIPPQRSWFITLLSLGMTPLLGLNLLLMLWWVCKRKLLAVLPLGVMLLNIGFITAMVQVNFRNETGRIADLKIATYNIHGFAQKELKSTMSNSGLLPGVQNDTGMPAGHHTGGIRSGHALLRRHSAGERDRDRHIQPVSHLFFVPVPLRRNRQQRHVGRHRSRRTPAANL